MSSINGSVQTPQDFTKNLVNVLQTGSDNLVLAGSNQEGASLLALLTRQQLSTTALSLADQASQGRAAPVRLNRYDGGLRPRGFLLRRDVGSAVRGFGPAVSFCGGTSVPPLSFGRPSTTNQIIQDPSTTIILH